MKLKTFIRTISLVLALLFMFAGCSAENTEESETKSQTTAALNEEPTDDTEGNTPTDTTPSTPKERVYTEVISYNIAYYESTDSQFSTPYVGQSATDYTIAKRQARLKSLVAHYSPDVLCLQEVNSLWWKYIITDEDSILKANKYEYVGNTGCFGNKDGVGDYREFYDLLFYDPSRFELIDSGTFWLSGNYDAPSQVPTTITNNGPTDRERMCTYAVLKDKLTGNETVYASTHLKTGGGNNEDNTNQAVRLITKLNEIAGDKPIIVCGDFNMSEENSNDNIMDTYQRITKNFKFNDARKNAANKETGGTVRSWGNVTNWKTGAVIDYCFYKNITAYQYRVLSDTFDSENKLSTSDSLVGINYDLSDHLGIYTKFIAK